MVVRPVISIINLCYNTGKHVIKTYESIKAQSFKNYELIVIDDCSTDDSFDIIKAWLEENADFPYKLIRNDQNAGITRSLNKGLKEVKGDYIALIGDDIWREEFLETLYGILSTTERNIGFIYTKADVFFTSSNKFDGEFNPFNFIKLLKYPRGNELFKESEIGDKIYFLKREKLFDALMWMNPIVAFSFLGKKEYFIKGYDTEYLIEDVPKWVELSKRCDVLYLDRSLAIYVRHGKNITITQKVPVLIDNLKLIIANYKYIKHQDTADHVVERISLALINNIGLRNLIKPGVKEFSYSLLKNPMLFSKVAFKTAKEKTAAYIRKR